MKNVLKKCFQRDSLQKIINREDWFTKFPIRNLNEKRVADKIYRFHKVSMKSINHAFIQQNTKYISLLYNSGYINVDALFKIIGECYSNTSSKILTNIRDYLILREPPHNLAPLVNSWFCVRHEILPLFIKDGKVIVLSTRCKTDNILEDEKHESSEPGFRDKKNCMTVGNITISIIKEIALREQSAGSILKDNEIDELNNLTPENLVFLICPQIFLFQAIETCCNQKSRISSLIDDKSYPDFAFNE